MKEKMEYQPWKRISEYEDFGERMAAYDARVEHFEKVREAQERGRKALAALEAQYKPKPSPEEMRARRVNAAAKAMRQAESLYHDPEAIQKQLEIYTIKDDNKEDFQRDVFERLKEQKYGVERQLGEMKFYYPVSWDDFQKMTQNGVLTSQKNLKNPVEGDLELTTDQRDANMRLVSGFDDVRNAKAKELTLVLDTSLLDEESLLALRDNPSVSKIDLQKYCLGVVVDDKETRAKVHELLREQKVDVPEYGVQQFERMQRGGNFGAEKARRLKEYAHHRNESERKQAEENRQYEEQMQRAVFARVNKGEIQKIQAPYVEKITLQDCKRLVQKYDRASGGAEKNTGSGESKEYDKLKEMCTEFSGYYAQVLGLKTVPKVTLASSNDMKGALGSCRWYYTEDNTKGFATLTFDQEKLSKKPAQQVFVAVAHECWHALQLQQRHEALQKNQIKHKLSKQYARVELYDWNFEHYINLNEDAVAYGNQLVEQEAVSFGHSCATAYQAAQEDLNKTWLDRIKDKRKQKTEQKAAKNQKRRAA